MVKEKVKTLLIVTAAVIAFCFAVSGILEWAFHVRISPWIFILLAAVQVLPTK